MNIALPSSTDIYLTGGKSHDSEIRLAKFLINHLQPEGRFLDIGAHYGYFTLLASEIVEAKGRITANEPASVSYNLLLKNTESNANITILKNAVSDKVETISFFEFPNLYSEYNSFNVSQFEGKQWFK